MSAVRALARVNVAAIARNCVRLRRELAPGVALCVVVKADGYGHGAVASARAALEGGAESLAVATAQEAAQLRQAGLRADVLVLGALTPLELQIAIEADADVVAWSTEFVDGVAALGRGRVHVKLDTGMGRLGTRDPEHANAIAEAVARAPELTLAGALTHFATADDPDDTFLHEQRERFAVWALALKRRHPQITLHAANSAATLRDRSTHFDMVRCGVAAYGLDPFGQDPDAWTLDPALALHSTVAAVKACRAGESAGYGRRFVVSRETTLATLPIGYGDGWRRGLTNNADVLISGRRYPLVGTVSMDNIPVDVGGDAPPVGATATLIGRDGAERITCEDVARRLDTINYEVTCGLSARIPREYHQDGEPLGGEVAIANGRKDA